MKKEGKQGGKTMGKPRPTEVHPYSKGVNKFLFHDIVINNHAYHYILMDGKQKTDAYNKGSINGMKKPVPLYTFSSYVEDKEPSKENQRNTKEKWLLAIPKEVVSSRMIDEKKSLFVGKVGVVKTYLLKMHNIETFLEYNCTLRECPYQGAEDCFKKNPFDCSSPNRKRHSAGRYCYGC